MSNPGIEEARATFAGAGEASLVGQIRRFGQYGPAYEVIEVKRSGDVVICVIESGETLDYGLSDLIADPMAETVP